MLPMDVVLECLSLREQRVSIDLVRDEVEAELNKVSDSYKTTNSDIKSNIIYDLVQFVIKVYLYIQK